MKQKRGLLYLILFLIAIAISSSRFCLHILLPHWTLENYPLHSTLEAFGALIAVLMAGFLFQRQQLEGSSRLFFLALGFLGMGILDGLHALSMPGSGFVFLHSTANLVGGFFFCLVCLLESKKYVSYNKWLPWIVAIGSLLFGVWVLAFPQNVPLMVKDGKFTSVAVAMNLIAGTLFFVSMSRFLILFHKSGDLEFYLFSCLGLIFGSAELMFKYSTIWNDDWWLWHIFRLIAYSLALGFLVLRYRKSISDFIQQKLLEEKAQADKQIAEAANRAKSEFIANMSHELRTPLNAIIGFGQILQAEYYGRMNEQQKDYVKDILDSGQHLLSLINDILDLSKIEAGRMELNISKLNLNEMLLRSTSLLKDKARIHSIKFQLSLDPVLPQEIDGDERKVKQVVFNFLSNAFKFTPDGGEVVLEVKITLDKRIEVSVTDSGPGIKEEDRKRLFVPFERLNSEAPGTGLGLALCKRIINLWDGEIGVISPPEGKEKGSRFYFTIPIKREESNESINC